MRSGLGAGQVRNGPWATGKTFGTTDASALIRAQVALAGLLALPAKEAMYYTARSDSAGRPLSGNCTYQVKGGALDARWWSLTLYRGEGWLVPNAANRWSVGSAAIPPTMSGQWTITVGPEGSGDLWIPTAKVPSFDLTLRTYHPQGALLNAPDKATLPTIERVACS